jgi:hypothetical protein
LPELSSKTSRTPCARSSDSITLSPGDLDEVVSMLVSANSHDSERGTAFSRVAAFRKGYFRGAGACTKQA